MKLRHLIAATFCLLSLASCATQKAARITKYEDGTVIITRSSGFIQNRYEGKPTYTAKPGYLTGKKVSFPKHEVVKAGVRKVPCGPQDGFSVLVIILGLPDGLSSIDEEIIHPLFLPPHDRLGTVRHRTGKIFSKNSKAFWAFEWAFDSAPEQVPGTWILRLSHRGKIIYEGTVDAVKLGNPS